MRNSLSSFLLLAAATSLSCGSGDSEPAAVSDEQPDALPANTLMGDMGVPGVVTPPAAEPPAATPPGMMPPAVEPPAVTPPAVTPPGAGVPPAVTPPDTTPAAETPPAVEPPAAETPPAVEPPAAETPPAVEPPAAETPPAVEPPAAETPPAVEPPAVTPPAGPITDRPMDANGCPAPKLYGWAATGPGTTGGGDAAPSVVSSAGDLKSALSGNDAKVVHFSGTISGHFSIGSNKTLRGSDKDATIDGGLSVNGDNVIVQNLTVKGKGAGDNGDAVNGSGSNIWFDHLNILDGGDGILDLVNGANNITTSWTKFWYTQSNHNHRFALLFSNDSGPAKCKLDGGRQHHTLHHNWFAELVDQRMPRLYYGTAHIYNNFYNSKGNSYCIGVGTWGKAIVENNYFKDVKHPHRRHNNYPTHIEAKGNVYDNTTGDQHTGANSIGEIDGRFDGEDCYKTLPDPGPWEPPYEYAVDPAEAIPELLQRCAGPQ